MNLEEVYYYLYNGVYMYLDVNNYKCRYVHVSRHKHWRAMTGFVERLVAFASCRTCDLFYKFTREHNRDSSPIAWFHEISANSPLTPATYRLSRTLAESSANLR